MKLNVVLRKAFARQKTVLWVSLAFGAFAFVGMYVLSHAAGSFGLRGKPIDLKGAAGWFLYLGSSVFVVGAAMNILGLLIAFLRGTLDEK